MALSQHFVTPQEYYNQFISAAEITLDDKVIDAFIYSIENKRGFFESKHYFLRVFMENVIKRADLDQNTKISLLTRLLRGLRDSSLYPLSYIPRDADIITIFFNILTNAYNEQRLPREDFYELLTAKNTYGMTPLHIAIKSNSKTVVACLDAMEQVFSPAQKMNFNMPTQKDSYLEWIVFRGDIHILQKYVAYLRKTDDDFAFHILLAQFENLRKIQPYEYATQHPIIQFLNLLHRASAENPTEILNTVRSRRKLTPYRYLYKWSVIAAHSLYPQPDEIQPEYVFSREEEKKITAYNIQLEEDELKHTMSFIL